MLSPEIVAQLDQMTAETNAQIDLYLDTLIGLRSRDGEGRTQSLTDLAALLGRHGIPMGGPAASMMLVAFDRLADVRQQGIA